jgi:DNA-binding NarL/FixJ family response regulator
MFSYRLPTTRNRTHLQTAIGIITMIDILIADDHPLLRQGLRQIIEAADFRVIAEASDGQEALGLLEQWQPAIAVLDVDMPKLNGFAVARAISERKWDMKVVFLTVHREKAYLQQALKLGANGYVLKDSAVTDITICLHTVLEGKTYFSPLLSDYLNDNLAASASVSNRNLSQLTASELHVLQLIAEYRSTREIAETLFISPSTVETHRKNICRKLDLHGSHALIKFALTHLDQLPE